MKRILLLGGTTEGLQLARTLSKNDIYSLAGLGQVPKDLPCQCRVGGFGGAEGLGVYLRQQRIELVLDLTHPYAQRISHHAVEAAAQVDIPCWALHRPAWQPSPQDDWRAWHTWSDLMERIATFRRPLFALGREPLEHLANIPPYQHWVIRCLNTEISVARATVISARGPFKLRDEHNLLTQHRVDVIVCKNSGNPATQAKLEVARTLKIPVLMRTRPLLPQANRTFMKIEDMLLALRS
ncbi:cobalt-precorrin-6A reductase [Pseudomonas duriflava]|uniref:cobalt-precorrin-6A reductase n=1 Tax=Pseudomonas duriflava TaxID=459528 RepID=UPI001ABF066C|nr:cobalt-precorrin-6A reductase [Pseudomonas duriflava]